MKKEIDIRSACKQYLVVLIILCFTSTSAASSFYYSGFVTGGSGVGPLLTPPGESVFLLFDTNVLQSGDFVNGSDITLLDFYVGGICFSANAANSCPLGSPLIPIINVETELMVYTPFSNDPFDGGLSFTGYSQTFQMLPTININFDTLLFTLDFLPTGSVSGCLNEVTPESEPCYTPAPLPGAILFLGSALLMSAAIKRHA